MHRILALLGGLSLLWGCESAELSGTALLEVSPEEVSFGAVPSGETRTVELRLRNPSPAAALRLDEVRLAEGSAATFEVSAAPTEIAPGAEVVVTLSYTPDTPQAEAGEVLIRSNAVSMPVRRVPVRSAQTFPKISVSPDRLDLGSILAGGQAEGTIQVRSIGDARLVLGRLALRGGGYQGEPCTSHAQCRDARCEASTSGLICATDCSQGCAPGYRCGLTDSGGQACLEDEGTRPALTLRGFEVRLPDAQANLTLLPGSTAALQIVYAPSALDRGGVQLLIDSDDAEQPTVIVPLVGRPEDLPPVAQVQLVGTPPDPVLPGTRLEVSGTGSFDPEGGALAWAWRFVRRPQGSRASFEAADRENTAFTVDRPGRYVAALEVLDESGQTSSNDARVEVEAVAGPGFEVELTWDRPGTDLDLHVVAPSGRIGAVSDCFFDNPQPDWAPVGPGGDPTFSAGLAQEMVAVTGPPEGVFTLVTTVVAASPEGPTAATVRIRLAGTEVARYSATLDPTAEAWDIATLTWPSGRITDIDSVR